MTVQPRVTRLSAPPRLSSVLARGACTSAAKRGPYREARLPQERLVLPGAGTDTRHLRAYARVCGFPEPGEGTPLPPSWPHVLGFPLAMRLMAGRDFPFPLLGLVHTGIELTQQRALDAEDRPEISVHAEHLEPHRRGTQFDVVTEARLGERLVWHSRSTYLCRHGGSSRQDRGADGSRGSGTDGGGSDGSGRRPEPPAPLPVHDHWRLPSALGRRYASASGDRNPIHLHPLTAKLFGFPRHIAHGMWTFARALAATGAAEGGEQLSARAEFKAPVLLPSTVAFGLDEPTASTGSYRAPVRVHRFELRRGGGEGEGPGRLHLTGEVTSEHLPSSGPGRSSRSS